MNNLDLLYEVQTEMLLDAMYSPQDRKCSECGEHFYDDDPIWILPHKCALNMKEEHGFVCSDECAEKWKETYWVWIEEYESDIKTGEVK